jgi:RNA recognition motif-containing protein
MSFTVFLGNLPAWVTADDIKSWLTAENLVSDAVKVIRNPETQESKGFAFIDAPNAEEMQAIIRRFDRAPLEDRLLRANPAQPPKSKTAGGPPSRTATSAAPPATGDRQGQVIDRNRGARAGKKHKRTGRESQGPQSAFAEELAKAL